MATYVPAKASTQYIVYVSLVSQANPKLMQVNPTIAAGDVKVSIDGAALANLGTLPTVSPAGSAMVKITLSTSEMAGANATVVCSDAAGAEWCDLVINIPTAARQIDDLAFPTTSGRSMVVDAAGLVDATMVKAGASGAGNTITTSGGVTLPAGTVASTTNLTAGTITTVSGNVNGSVASVTGAVGSVTGNVGGNVVGSVGSLTTVAVDNILDRTDGVELGLTPRGALRLTAAASAGELAGATTPTITIRNAVSNSKTRITASVDGGGNRTAVTTDVT